MTEIFRSYPDFYAKNVIEGERATVQDATLESPTGTQDAGIAIRIDGIPRLVIRTTDALRIANRIADIASTQRSRHHNNQEDAS